MIRQKIWQLTLMMASGFLMLLLGWLVYASRTGYWFAPDIDTPLSLPFVYNLPSFVHAFAFTLLTVAVLGLRQNVIFLAAGLWLGLELIFEVGQHKVFTPWWQNGFLPEHVKAYFLAGTFDDADVVAIFLGVIAASVFGQALGARGGMNE